MCQEKQKMAMAELEILMQKTVLKYTPMEFTQTFANFTDSLLINTQKIQ